MNISGEKNQIKTYKGLEESKKKLFFKRRRGCPLSARGSPKITYKDPDLLFKFVSEGGRILPSRVTNMSAIKQRKLRKEIKIARILALMPFFSNTSR